MQDLIHVTISRKAEESLRGGHVWVFADEVGKMEEEPTDGTLVHVYSEKEKYLGTGFYNSHSKIRIRIISTNANDTFDENFWRRRVRWALEYRATVMGKDFVCSRLIQSSFINSKGQLQKLNDILRVIFPVKDLSGKKRPVGNDIIHLKAFHPVQLSFRIDGPGMDLLAVIVGTPDQLFRDKAGTDAEKVNIFILEIIAVGRRQDISCHDIRILFLDLLQITVAGGA